MTKEPNSLEPIHMELVRKRWETDGKGNYSACIFVFKYRCPHCDKDQLWEGRIPVHTPNGYTVPLQCDCGKQAHIIINDFMSGQADVKYLN